MAKAKADIRALARAHTVTAIKTLAGIMQQGSANPAARVAAAQALLDRGWGKPEVHIEIDETIHWVITDETMDESEWSTNYINSLAAPTRATESLN